MAYQETQAVPQKPERSTDSNDSAMGSIFGFSTLSLGTSTTTDAAHKSPCARCGFYPGGCNSGSSLKRASPCSPTPSSVPHLHDHHPPRPKKLFLDPVPDSTLASSKPSLPPPHTPSRSLLRRCVSDPCKSPVAADNVGPTAQSPDHPVNVDSCPTQNNLRRCFSDPCKSPVAATNNNDSNLGTIQSPELAVQCSTSDVALLPPTHRKSISSVATPPATTKVMVSQDSDKKKGFFFSPPFNFLSSMFRFR